MTGGTSGQFADPQKIATHFHLREGDVVADFGAGSGHYLGPLARLVGASGKVYACEIQKNLVESLGIKARELKLSNVHPVWCDIEAPNGSKLQDGLLDAALLSNTLFQCTDKQATLKEIARTLRVGGKLFIIDWADPFGQMGPRSGQVIPIHEVQNMATAAGLSYDRDFPAGDHHYGLAFRKT